MRRCLTLCICAGIPAFLAAAGALGADYYVNDSMPEPPFAAGHNGNSGTSPAEPMAGIQALLDRYPGIGAGDTVHVSAGTYIENIVVGESHNGITLSGASSGSTIIDGGLRGRCISIGHGTITGFTIINGNAPDGGGILVQARCCEVPDPAAEVLITGNIITGNRASSNGGGIFVSSHSDETAVAIPVRITGNTIWENKASNGGGIYSSAFLGSVSIVDNAIVHNTANYCAGLAVYCADGSQDICNNVISANDSLNEGGGLGVFGFAVYAPGLTWWSVAANSIADNSAGTIGGGLISDGIDGTFTVARNCIAANRAGGNGGGVHSTGGIGFLENNILRNVAQDGGGIYFSSQPRYVMNNVIAGNAAAGMGGGVACGEIGLLTQNTIANNSASGGGGLHIRGEATVSNSILWNNTVSNGSGSQVHLAPGAGVCSLSYNAICGESGALFAGSNASFILSHNIDSDPLFANGDYDFHLASERGRWCPTGSWQNDAVSSPCIDAGDPAADYSNEPMPNGSRLNLGAYGNTIYASKSPPPPSITDLTACLVCTGSDVEIPPAYAFGSNSLYGIYIGANAIDDDPATFWSSQASVDTPRRQWLMVDLDLVQTVSRVRLLPRASKPGLFPAEFVVETSIDGSAWTEAAAEQAYTAQPDQWYDSHFRPVRARFVRVCGIARIVGDGRNEYYMQIAEFKVYGPMTQEVHLGWTAPRRGNIDILAYDVRHSPAELTTEDAWNNATQLAGAPAPGTPETLEMMTLTLDQLPIDALVYFGVRIVCTSSEMAGLSNSPSLQMLGDITPPAAVDDLAVAIVDVGPPYKLPTAVASCSTALYGVYTAAGATDNDPTTFWSSGPSLQPRNEWLMADLGCPQRVAGVRMLPRATSVELFPAGFSIQVSNNAIDWTEAAARTGYIAAAGTWCEVSFETFLARYVRLSAPSMLISDGRTEHYIQIAEFQVMTPLQQAVVLAWTAPGDDGAAGTPSSYAVRFGSGAIVNRTTWEAACDAAGQPLPLPAGTRQSMNISTNNLPPGETLCFNIRTADDSGNQSLLSNCAMVVTPPVRIAGPDQPAVSDAADVNGDGRVNIIDLLFVRARLNQSPLTAGNETADVNGDGRIDISDLIAVRNSLGR